MIKKILPKHIAIIMDGNGRWAREKGFSRIKGHQEGMKNLIKIVKKSSEIGIKFLTVYAFSTENWRRPEKEIKFLFQLLKLYLKKEIDNLIKNNIKLKFIGDKKNLPLNIVKIIKEGEKLTENSKGLNLNIAFNYGGRKEIVDSFNNIIKLNINNISKLLINEDIISQNLYTNNIPNPEVLIRTSGEYRLSNFLLWQLAYTELFFVDKYWPDFNELEYKKILIKYMNRKRRFGGI